MGLIVNELITNAYKHAFENRKNGRIDVSFERESDEDNMKRWVLTVKDDGVGLSEDVKPERSDSLGWRMIRAMTARLSGTIETGSDEGFHTRIEFPGAFAEGKT